MKILDFLEKGFLLSPDLIDKLGNGFDKEKFSKLKDVVVLNKDVLNGGSKFNWVEFDSARVLFEKNKENLEYKEFLDVINYKDEKILEEVGKEDEIVVEDYKDDSSVVVLNSYSEDSKKRELKDFVSYFKIRYEDIKKMLQGRHELRDVISINRLMNKESNDSVVLIGIVNGKRMTKKGDFLLNIEDLTGNANVWFRKDVEGIKDICLDEVIGITGSLGDGLVFGRDLVLPDISLSKEFKKSDDVNVLFLSDIHVGNKLFLENNFETMLKWLNGEYGSEEDKELASKIKYVFITGDCVEGIGIYAGQDEDCDIKDIYKQYDKFVEYIKRISKHIKIVICPGNHDALRVDEPQPVLGKDLVKELYDMDNVFLVSNPALVNIHSSADFSGFDVLMYHGMSFNYYAENIESVRVEGGMTRSDLIMKYLLRVRHLAPTHTSTAYIPDVKKDNLVIEKVPDFFISGHIHRCSVDNYKNVTLVNGSCWVEQSDFMEKVGLVPEPGRAIVANLQTRDVKVVKFYED